MTLRVEAEAVACRRGGRLVLRDVSFALRPGDALVVTGPNGAGKSTLLAAIAGTVPLAGGAIRHAGAGERSLPECLHVVAHRDALKGALSAEENLHFATSLLGAPRLSPAEALARVGLKGAGPLPVATLSAGQRRRVALARLLCSFRPLWLLDEPTTALDAAGQALLGPLLSAHREAGGLVIAATHTALPLDAARMLPLGPSAP